jgi:glycosyltransferase involved in cell wall biosynthesis
MCARRLSVVIPTFNRHQRLERVLDALESQTLLAEHYEVIVVDDGSTDGTFEELGARKSSFELRCFRQDNSGPALARNYGVKRATGELIVFLDDDVVPLPELLAEHAQSHDAESGELAVIGPLQSLPHYDAPWVAWEQEKLEWQYEAMTRGDFEPTFRQFWTGNASVAKRNVERAGFFDAEFLRAEDVELGLRLKECGVVFRFNPRAGGLHHADRSLESWKKMHSSYGRLEVQILDRLGPNSLVEILGENLNGLNPAVRMAVRATSGSEFSCAFLVGRLATLLENDLTRRSSRLTSAACSLMANLLYWQASRAALGPTRFERVLHEARALS